MHPFFLQLYSKQVLTCLYYPSIFCRQSPRSSSSALIEDERKCLAFLELAHFEILTYVIPNSSSSYQERVWKLVKHFFSHVNDMIVSFSNCFPGTYTVLTIFSWALLLSGCWLSCSLACFYKCIFDKWLLVKLFFSLWLYKFIFDNLIRMSWCYVGKYFQTIKCRFSFFTVNFAAWSNLIRKDAISNQVMKITTKIFSNC